LTKAPFHAIIKVQKRDTKEVTKMIRNTYYKVMNETDEVFTTTDSLREAKKVAKAIAIERKEWIWVIDVLNNNEVVMYEEDGKEF
jgi:DNA-directed RNA polymerase specialized sigma subunit